MTQQRANRFHLVVKETPHQSHLKPQPANDEKCVYCGGEGGGRRRPVSPSKPRGVTKILVFVGVPQWGPGYLFQISCTCRHFSQAFFWAGPAGEYKVVFTYLPLRSQCLPKAACYNVCYHGNILVRAGNLKKEQASCSGFPPFLSFSLS